MQETRTLRSQWIRDALSQYQQSLTRYALQITGDLERARDVVQDTFLQLCRADSSRVGEHLAEWLFTVCRNRALTVRRKENRMTPLSEERLPAQVSPTPSPYRQLEVDQSLRRVLEVVEGLGENQREVVRLKFQNDLSYKEISRITGLSVSNVGYLLHNALKTIREECECERPRRTGVSIRRVK